MRQPLFVLDFCRAIEVCMDRKPDGTVYDLVGPDRRIMNRQSLLLLSRCGEERCGESRVLGH
jgi:hypothetical protein